MQIVYHAAHSADAQLVCGLLAQAGIQAFVFGSALEGGAGLLPAGSSVRVEVADEEATRARAIIERWQAEEVPVDPDEVDDEHDDGENRPAPDPIEDDNLYRPLNQRTPRPRGFGWGAIVFAVLAGALLGALVIGAAMRPGVSSQEADYDGDGVADERMFFEGDRLVRVDADRNSDGHDDSVSLYDENGLPRSIEEDQDFSGVRETTSTLSKGLLAARVADYDGDGRSERQEQYRNGVLQNVEWLDAQGRVSKRDTYAGGRLHSGEIDSNGDGKLDTARLYDERGEARSSEPLPTQ